MTAGPACIHQAEGWQTEQPLASSNDELCQAHTEEVSS